MDPEHSAEDPLPESVKKPLLTEKSVTSSRHWLEVRDVMSRQVATVSPDHTVVEAAKMMKTRNISCAVVLDNKDRVVGILTERDLLQRVAAKEGDFGEKKVSEAMTFPVQSISPAISIFEASTILESKKIRRLPVVENGELVGIVTQTDLTRVLASYGMWRTVGDVMSPNVSTIQQTESVWIASVEMSKRNVSCVVVMDGEKVSGILTERDVMKKIVALQRDPREIRITEVMSSPVLCIAADHSVFSAIKLIEEKKIRRLVVMEGAKLRGVLTQTDIFRTVKQKLQEEEESYVNMLEQSENAIYTADLNGLTTYVNPAFLRILQIENRSDLIGQEFLPERFWMDPKDRIRLMGQLRRGVSIEIKDLILKSAKDRKIFATLFWTFTKNVHGEVNGNQGLLYDITQKKELVSLREAEDHLRKSNEALHRLNEMKSDFVSMVTHELRTPMTVVRGRIDLILAQDYGAINEEQRRSLQVAVEHIDRLARMIDNLLDLSKMEAGKFTLKCDWLDLAAVAQHANESFSIKAREKNLDLKLEAPEGRLVYADEDRLIQVLTNLLGNAIKFTERGEVKISILEREEDFECVVSDTGPGISKDDIGKLFEKYEQAKQQLKIPEKGTGLGLSITKEIVTMHGGKIWLTSELRVGTQVHFTLPKRTVLEVFRKTVKEAIREAMEKDMRVSLVMMPVELLPGEDPPVTAQLWRAVLSGMKSVIEQTFRRGADGVVRGERQLMIVLADCTKDNAWRALERFQVALKTFLRERRLQDRVKMSFVYVTYPDEGGNEVDLLDNLVQKISKSGHSF